jgi:hypothetical protein
MLEVETHACAHGSVASKVKAQSWFMLTCTSRVSYCCRWRNDFTSFRGIFSQWTMERDGCCCVTDVEYVSRGSNQQGEALCHCFILIRCSGSVHEAEVMSTCCCQLRPNQLSQDLWVSVEQMAGNCGSSYDLWVVLSCIPTKMGKHIRASWAMWLCLKESVDCEMTEFEYSTAHK